MSDVVDLTVDSRSGQKDPAFLVVDRYFENKERHVDQGLSLLKDFMGLADGLAREFLALQRERLAARSAPVPVTMHDVLQALASSEARGGKAEAAASRGTEGVEGTLKSILNQLSSITSALSALESRVRQFEARGAGDDAEGEEAVGLSNKNAGSWGKWQESSGANSRSVEDFLKNYEDFAQKYKNKANADLKKS